MILELIKKSRTHRHFTNEKISKESIFKILEGARFSPSASNQQIFKYKYVVDDEICAKLFPNIALGGALKLDEKPTIQEQPQAYIAIITKNSSNLNDREFFNMGIAAQNMFLVANDLGYNSCMIMAFNRKEIDKILELPEDYSTKCVLVFGKGKENVRVVDIHSNEDTKYFRKDGFHNVPKIILDDLIIK